MKKIIIILIILSSASVCMATLCPDGIEGVGSWDSSYTTSGSYGVINRGTWDNFQEMYDTYLTQTGNNVSWSGYCQPGLPTGVGWGGNSRYYDGNIHCFNYNTGGTGCTVADSDGDGIDDWIDPFPDDPGEFVFIKVAEWRDTQGNLVSTVYKCVNTSTGEVTYMEIGSHDAADEFWGVVGGQSWQDADTYATLVGGETNASNDGPNPDLQYVDAELPPDAYDTEDNSTDYDAGNDSTGNTTDTEHLSDIVDNTQSIADNQIAQGETLREISDKLSNIGEVQVVIANSGSELGSPDGGGTDLTAEDIADEIIGDGTGTELNPNYSALDTAQTGTENALNTTNDLAVDAPEAYRQKTDIQDEIDEIESNTVVQSIKDIFTNSSVSATGSPCFSHVYNGSTINFCIDEFQPQLAAWGVLMLSMVSLHALLIVFRRR